MDPVLAAAGAALGLGSGTLKTIGGAKKRQAERKALRQQAKFYKKDAKAVESLYEDRADRLRDQGEAQISQNEAMIGKYGGAEQLGEGTSLSAVQDKSYENLETDVSNLLKQGEIEANRLRFQAKQAKQGAKTSAGMEGLMLGSSILDTVMSSAKTGMQFGGAGG